MSYTQKETMTSPDPDEVTESETHTYERYAEDDKDLIETETPVRNIKKATAANVETAYKKYLGREIGSQEELFEVVGRLAYWVCWRQMHTTSQISQTIEDAAQDATLSVWQSIGSFRGQPKQFYSWVKRICLNHGTDGFNKGVSESAKRIPLEMQNEEGDVMENPAINGGLEFKHNGKVEYRPSRPQARRELPEFIQGIDLDICNYIREGYNYAFIGEVMRMTEKAVELRIARMRKKIEGIKNAKC